MFCIPKTGDYLKVLTDDEVKNVLVINFGEYYKSVGQKLYFKKNLKKFADEVEKYIEIM